MPASETYECHECGRKIKGVYDGRIDLNRLARHKEPREGPGFRPWCPGSGQIPEHAA